MSLRDISRFVVPENIVEHTDEELREAGEDYLERFVLWAGVEHGQTFEVRSSHVPAQTAYRTEHGLLVEVEGPALHRLNVWLHEHGEVLGMQVHAHPDHAYHSETDDTYPIVTELGALSIVVPRFAQDGVRGPRMAAYRLTNKGWRRLRPAELRSLVEFV